MKKTYISRFSRTVSAAICIIAFLTTTSVFGLDNPVFQIGKVMIGNTVNARHPDFSHEFLGAILDFRFVSGELSPCLDEPSTTCRRLIAFIDGEHPADRILIDSFSSDEGEPHIEALSFYNLDRDRGTEIILIMTRYYNTVDIKGYAYEIHFYDNKAVDTGNLKKLAEMDDILPERSRYGFDGYLQGKRSVFPLKNIASIKQRLHKVQ
ncbi:MAG TPA: hypothetical protein ENK26_07200 [Gammaproteobacteria bacterium]|nr:hypothetical protein [Gammaproteobacteria bacterium]